MRNVIAVLAAVLLLAGCGGEEAALDLAGGKVLAVDVEEADVLVSADGGGTWSRRGSLGIEAGELAAGRDGTLYASVPGGEVKSSGDGGATWKRYAKLK